MTLYRPVPEGASVRFGEPRIAVSAIFAATHGGKKELGTVFLSEWIAVFFLKTALKRKSIVEILSS